jgi:hypothetical protein
MGWIFSNFSASMFPDGIPFEHIQQIANSIPGKSTVFGVNYFSMSSFYVLKILNDLFEDGTEIVPKFKSVTFSPPNKPSYCVTIFDGIDVIDPPIQKVPVPPTNNVGSSGQGLYPNGGGWYSNNNNSPYSLSPTGTYNYKVTSVFLGDPDAEKETKPSNPTNKCTCGAHAVGGGHSNYCDTQGLQP